MGIPELPTDNQPGRWKSKLEGTIMGPAPHPRTIGM
jgi:hypothetical protein